MALRSQIETLIILLTRDFAQMGFRSGPTLYAIPGLFLLAPDLFSRGPKDKTIFYGAKRNESQCLSTPAMIEVGDYHLEVDAQATANCYAVRGAQGPEACDCCYCRNWVAGREILVPEEISNLLSQLGIPKDGEIEVWRVPGDDHPHGYGGWYMLVGRITQSPPEPLREFNIGGWRLSFSQGVSYSVDEFTGRDVFELHFFTWADSYIDDKDLNAD